MDANRLAPGRSVRAGRAAGRVAAALCAWMACAASAWCDDRGDADPESYLAANGFLNRGLYDLAVEEYRKFLTAAPNHARAAVARYGLGVALYRLKRFDEAAKELGGVKPDKTFAFGAETFTLLGQCRLEQKDYGAAADAFRRVVTEFKEHDLADDAAAGWVEALHLSERHDDVLARARELGARWPDSPMRERSEYFAALSELARGDSAAAAGRLAEYVKRYAGGPYAQHASLLLAQSLQAQGRLDLAAAEYERGLAQADNPYRDDAAYGLAAVRMQAGEFGPAVELLDRLLATPLAQSDVKAEAAAARGGLLARARLARARCRLELGDADEAARELEPLRASDDASLAAEASYWFARCRLRSDKPADAARALDEALARAPQSPLRAEMTYDRAVALVRAGDFAAAGAALADFLKSQPKHALAPDALHLLACALHQQRDYDRSAARCREFLKLHAEHGLAPSVTFLAAENEFLAGRMEPAVAGYKAVLERDPRGPTAARARGRLGTALHRLGRLDEAAAQLEEVPADAGIPTAPLLLGDIAFQRGQWEQAERRLGEYLAADREGPGADDALLKLGLARARQQHHDDALLAFDELIARFPKSIHRAQALFERGQSLLSLKRDDEAAEAFRQVAAAEDARLKPHALTHLGTIAYGKQEFEKASELFALAGDTSGGGGTASDTEYQRGLALAAQQKFAEAEAVLAGFLARHPKHASAASAAAQRGICLARLDRFEDALRVFDKLERDAADLLDARLLDSVRYERAWCLRRLGKDDEAAGALRSLIERKDGAPNGYALLELADIELRKKRPADAAALLLTLREHLSAGRVKGGDDLVEAATYRLAAAEYEQEHFAPAAELFEEVATRFERGALARSAALLAGECRVRGGQPERAVEWLERAVSAPVDDAGQATALLRLGEACAALQQWPRSEKAFTDLLSRFPRHESWFQAQFGVGWARENQGRYDEALEAYRAVVEKHKGATAARAQFQIGECLFARDKLDDAVRELLKVDILYSYPEWSAAANYEAGRCFEKLGRSVEARRQFRVVTEKFGNTRWAELAAQRLAELPTDPRHGG